ncbi:glycosyltransferase family 2 protein [Clostridiisalibacter paucivorans]|uniref:glycosyltransferase family 2 protein n=1 Tax=Clostridiisalibacter paucivorans TaxID=408753 RepID=UPI000479D6BB|nr:glycosyltransferase family 2 protein [Clostridiisalibacter paucivorans]
MERSKISIVIPVYNGENSIKELYYRIDKVFLKQHYDIEIIFVDDCSDDKSFEYIKEIAKKNINVKGIKLKENAGQQNAILCGFRHSIGDIVITMDDDLQHLPEEIPKLLDEINKGYDVVYGIPHIKQHRFYRNIGSKFTEYLFRYVLGKPKDFRISSFRAIRRGIVNKINRYQGKFVYISASMLKYTKSITNVIVVHSLRKYGKSNYNFFKLMKLFLKLYIYYSNSFVTRLFIKKGEQYIIEEKYL